MKYPDIVFMDESKKVVWSNDPEFIESVVELVAGDSGHPERSDIEARMGEEGGSCNGDDIMVEVLGSHVYVDGICTADGGGALGNNSNNEAVGARDNNSEAHHPDESRWLDGDGKEVISGSEGDASKLESMQEDAVGMDDDQNAGDRPSVESISVGIAAKDEKQSMEEENISPGNDTGEGNLSIGEKMEVKKQVSDGQKVNLNGDQEVQINAGSVMVETVGDGTENISVGCADSASLITKSNMVQSLVADVREVVMENNNDSSLNGDHTKPVEENQKQKSVDVDAIHAYSDGLHLNIKEKVNGSEHYDLHSGQQMEVEEQELDPEQPRNPEEETGRSVEVHQPKYELPPDDGEFFISDLVWGKVRSHPWWPGQIFDPSDASQKAIKHHKKDSFLVAYFGDRTFSWNEASLLKPFRTHFSVADRQSNSEAFQNAVNCALEEVSRRVEMGLTCSCSPKDIYDKIRFQVVENTGIQEESSVKEGGDRSFAAVSFEPDKLLEYMKALAQCPSGGGDRFDLVIAKAQLSAFYLLRGYHPLPEFQSGRDLLENDAINSKFEESIHFGDSMEGAIPVDLDDQQISYVRENLEQQRGSYHKRKHDLKSGLYPSKRKRSLSELMGETFDSLDTEGSDGKAESKLASPSSSMKRKSADSFSEDMEEGRKTISLAKVSLTQFPKPSFKIGECISRVASQMTGSPSILKGTGDRLQKLNGIHGDAADGIDLPSEIYEDAIELLSELQLAACDPMKDFSFQDAIVSFFQDFRNSFVLDQLPVDNEGCKRKRFPDSLVASTETFEFDDMSDTYWTDRIVQNGSEEQLPHGNGKVDYQIVPFEFEKPVQRGRKYRKRFSDGNRDVIAEKPPLNVNERAPAELVMTFSELKSIPSESKLINMFRHFGPLKESETEVDCETSRARVVFRKCVDAEVAFNSAEKFNIFGAVSVNYKLNYSISESFKASLYAPTIPAETPMLSQTLGERISFMGSTLGDNSPLVASTLAEEESFMVSTLGDDGLPILTSFGEDNSYMTVMLSEETLHVDTTVGEETFHVSTTASAETLAAGISEDVTSRLSETNGKQTLHVAPHTVEERMISATTLVEQISIGSMTAGEPTSTVATSVGEQTWTTSASVVEERSTTNTNMSERTCFVTTHAGEEPPKMSTTVGEEALIDARTDCEQPLDDAAMAGEKASIIAPGIDEEASGMVASLGQEYFGPKSLDEEALGAATTLGGDISSSANYGEVASTTSTTSEDGTLAVPVTSGEEVSAVPTTLGGETLAIISDPGDKSFTEATEAEKMLPASVVDEMPTVVVTLGEETSAVPATCDEETAAVPTTSGGEKLAIVSDPGDKSLMSATIAEETLPATLDDETLAVAETSGEVASTVDAMLMVTTALGTVSRTSGDGTLGKACSRTVMMTLGETTSTVVTTRHEASPKPTSTVTEATDVETAFAAAT